MEVRLYRLARTGFGIALLAATVSACGSASDATPAVLDACTIIDKAAAADIVGEVVTPTPIDSAAAAKNGVSMCNYEAQTLHNGFMLTVGPHGSSDLANSAAAEMEQNIASANDAFPGANAKGSEINGLGDAAYALTTDFYIQIYAYKGAYRVLVNRNVAPSPTTIEATTKLAKLALTALP